jgi:hypothetical protein
LLRCNDFGLRWRGLRAGRLGAARGAGQARGGASRCEQVLAGAASRAAAGPRRGPERGREPGACGAVLSLLSSRPAISLSRPSQTPSLPGRAPRLEACQPGQRGACERLSGAGRGAGACAGLGLPRGSQGSRGSRRNTLRDIPLRGCHPPHGYAILVMRSRCPRPRSGDDHQGARPAPRDHRGRHHYTGPGEGTGLLPETPPPARPRVRMGTGAEAPAASDEDRGRDDALGPGTPRRYGAQVDCQQRARRTSPRTCDDTPRAGESETAEPSITNHQ